MPKHSVSEAARLAGISRSYLYRKYITPGKITVEKDGEGNPTIDTSEIMRVFGSLQVDSEQVVECRQLYATQKDSEDSVLRAENQLLREQLTAAAERERWMQGKIDQLADQLANTTRLLEYKETSATPKDELVKEQQGSLNKLRKESIWNRILGRKATTEYERG